MARTEGLGTFLPHGSSLNVERVKPMNGKNDPNVLIKNVSMCDANMCVIENCKG